MYVLSFRSRLGEKQRFVLLIVMIHMDSSVSSFGHSVNAILDTIRRIDREVLSLLPRKPLFAPKKREKKMVWLKNHARSLCRSARTTWRPTGHDGHKERKFRRHGPSGPAFWAAHSARPVSISGRPTRLRPPFPSRKREPPNKSPARLRSRRCPPPRTTTPTTTAPADPSCPTSSPRAARPATRYSPHPLSRPLIPHLPLRPPATDGRRALLSVLRRRGMPSTRAWRSTRTRSPPRSPPWGSSTPPTARSPAPTSSATAAPPG